MEMYKGSVASKSKKGNSMKGDDGEWYSLFAAEDFKGEWKDQVEFLWEYDKSGKYRNIKKGSMKVTGDSGSSYTPPKKFNNLGVELGHAANLAMTLTLAGDFEPGSKDMYKFWMEHTDNVYKMMKGIRARYEEPAKEVKEAVAPSPVAKEAVTEDDLF